MSQTHTRAHTFTNAYIGNGESKRRRIAYKYFIIMLMYFIHTHTNTSNWHTQICNIKRVCKSRTSTVRSMRKLVEGNLVSCECDIYGNKYGYWIVYWHTVSVYVDWDVMYVEHLQSRTKKVPRDSTVELENHNVAVVFSPYHRCCVMPCNVLTTGISIRIHLYCLIESKYKELETSKCFEYSYG